MLNIALNLDSTSTGNDDSKTYIWSTRFRTPQFDLLSDLSIDEQSINQALLTLDGSDESSSIPAIGTTTAVSVAELPSGITDSLNVAAKQLSHLYDSVVSTATTETGEELNEGVDYREQGISDSFVEVYTEEDEGKKILSIRTIFKKKFSSKMKFNLYRQFPKQPPVVANHRNDTS